MLPNSMRSQSRMVARCVYRRDIGPIRNGYIWQGRSATSQIRADPLTWQMYDSGTLDLIGKELQSKALGARWTPFRPKRFAIFMLKWGFRV